MGGLFLQDMEGQPTASENVRFEKLGKLVFRWGDRQAEEVLSTALEEMRTTTPDACDPALVTVVWDQLWSLNLCEAGFEPENIHQSPVDYTVVAFDEASAKEDIDKIFAREQYTAIYGTMAHDIVLLCR